MPISHISRSMVAIGKRYCQTSKYMKKMTQNTPVDLVSFLHTGLFVQSVCLGAVQNAQK